MVINDFYCTLDFDDIDLSRPELWRPRMIELVSDELFGTLLTDLAVTGAEIGALPTARAFEGGCHVEGGFGSGGFSGGLSCGGRF